MPRQHTDMEQAVVPVGASEGRRHRARGVLFALLAVLLLCGGIAATFRYYLAPPLWGKNYALSDDRVYYGPNTFFFDVSLKNGEFPLWNPLSYCGAPFAADPQTSVYYPPHILRSLLTPAYSPRASAASMQIVRFLHMLLLGLGTYVLARSYALGWWGSIAAAFAYMLAPITLINFSEYYVIPIVVAWVPWLLWAAHRACTARDIWSRLYWLVWAVVFHTLSTLAGFPQLGMYLGVMVVFFFLFDALFHLPPRSDAPSCVAGGARVRSWLKTCGVFLSGRCLLLTSLVLLTILASCAMLVPSFELTRHSARVVTSGFRVTPLLSQDLHWLHLLKCVIVFPGNTWIAQGPRAAGIGSLLLAMLALSHYRRRDVAVFLGLYLVMTDCAIGPPLPVSTLLQAVDIFNITLSPWRALCFTGLGLAMLVGFGVDALSVRVNSLPRRFIRVAVLGTIGIVMTLFLRHWMGNEPLYEPWFWVWLAPLALTVALCAFTWWHRPRLAVALVALLMVAELLAWSTQMMPLYLERRVQQRFPESGFGEAQALPDHNRRTAVGRANDNMWTLNMSMLGYNPLYVAETRNALCQPGGENQYAVRLLPDQVVTHNHRGNIFLKRSFWLAQHGVSGRLPDKNTLFPATTTVFLPDISGDEGGVASLDVPRTSVSEETTRVALLTGEALDKAVRSGGDETTVALPPFQSGGRHCAVFVRLESAKTFDLTASCRDEKGIHHPMKQSRVTPAPGMEQTVEIPLPDCDVASVTLSWPRSVTESVALREVYALRDDADENALIHIESYTANTAQLRIGPLPGPRILTFVDSYYPGWRAWVNGEEAEVLRANDAFKAVFLPAGEHEVLFSFQPESFEKGLRISLRTGALLALILAVTTLRLFSRKVRGASALGVVCILMLTALFSACSTTGYRERADEEVYGILESVSEDVPGADSDFSIEAPDNNVSLAHLPVSSVTEHGLGDGIASEAGNVILGLDDALSLAVNHNRSYQTAKETLYLQALALTLDRHRYTPIFSGGAQAALRRSAADQTVPSQFNEIMSGAGAIISELENLTGTQADLLRAYADVIDEAGRAAGLDQPSTRLVEERRVTGRSTFGVDRLMQGGGRIAASITTDFLRFLTGDPRARSGSTLNLLVTQPLLRGAGRDIAAERLTQSERDTLYALREFTHYRKRFTVEVCSAYYGVLQQRDVARNTWIGLENFRLNVERERAFAEEGLRTQAELGRMVQAQLDNENRYINAVRRYQEDLDAFKILLGLSTDTAIVLDDAALDVLRQEGLDHPDVTPEDAIRVALVSRLDYYNDVGRVYDAERRVRVAANMLHPGIDFIADAAVPTSGINSPMDFDFNRMDWSLGLDVDPQFDRKAERNAYRAALIDLERALRRSSLAEDTIKLDVRATWRNLEQARRNYLVAVESVGLSERRVEEQRLLAELGEATAQDQVDAQNDLIQSQNNLTSALIAHTLARLAFWRDMGLLYVGPDGVWREPPVNEVSGFESE